MNKQYITEITYVELPVTPGGLAKIGVKCECGFESAHSTPKAAMRAGGRHTGDHANGRRGFAVGTGILSHPVGW